jgi:riboflavin synthase
MFTGLVQDLGRIEEISHSDGGVRLRVSSPLAGELAEGDSIAVGGVCLTATAVQNGTFSAEVMNETLSRTALERAAQGGAVNLELPLRASDRIGGHIVQGHVDAIGTVSNLTEDGFARRIEIEAPGSVLRYLVEKGSVAVDGVSLTVAELGNDSFTVFLIPETLERTTLGTAQPGTKVNLEVDVLAKYVEKAMRSIAGQGDRS